MHMGNSIEKSYLNMRLLLLVSFVTFVLSDELLFDKNDPNLEKKPIWEGGVFKYAITIDKSTTPITVALMIDGNGLRDEATVTVNDIKDADKLKVSDHYHTIAASLGDQIFGVISYQEEPGVLYLVQNGACKKRTYSKSDIQLREREEEFAGVFCRKINEEIRKLDLEYEEGTQLQQKTTNLRQLQMLYFRPPSRKLEKWDLDFGGTFYFGAVLDTATTPATFAIHISGNGINDELYVRLDDNKEVDKVRVFNKEEILFVNVITKEFMIGCKKSKPGLIVKSRDQCKSLTYDEHNQMSKPTEELIDKDECANLMSEFQKMAVSRDRSEIMYTMKDDETLEKDNLKFGGTFFYGTVVERSENELPNKFGVYIKGNAIEDEFRVTFKDENPADLMKIINGIDRIIFTFPTRDLSVIAKSNENGLVVIEKNKCKRRIYNDENPSLQPTQKMVSQETCKEKISEVEAALPLEPKFLYFLAETPNVSKKVSMDGETFKYGTVWDKRDSQSERFKLGIYIKGTFLEDELHLDVKSDEEANSVEVANQKDKIIVKLPSQRFGVIAKVSTRGELIFVEKGVCKRRMYKPRKIQLNSEVELDHDKCIAMMKEIGIEIPPT